jgi:hypothetical protein
MLDQLIKTAYSRGGSSSEKITSLARRAAQRFVSSDDKNLTAAVSSVVTEEGDLSRDQIQRVTEAANQETWKALFVEGEGDTSGVHFDPADASDVLSDVAPSAPQVSERNTDYDHAPAVGGMDDLLSAFDVEEKAPPMAAFNPAADAEQVHEKVSHARDFMKSQSDELYLTLTQQSNRVYQLIKTASAEGEPFFTICKAVDQACEDPQWAAEVLRIAGGQLKADGIRPNMEKVAHQITINSDHPLVVETSRMEKLARDYVRSGMAHQRLEEQSKKTLGYLRGKILEA